ncbi:MAG: hypothetical protein HUU45_11850 [Leptospiraceae bacterium]|nr:hypothetical protein [Leptospiraceae bacterium]
MITKQLLTDHIKTYLPYDYEILGEEMVSNIIDNHLSGNNAPITIHSSKYGRNMDLVSIITIVGVAVQVIDFTIRIKEKTKGKKDQSIKLDAIKMELKKEINNFNENTNDYDELIQKILNEK